MLLALILNVMSHLGQDNSHVPQLSHLQNGRDGCLTPARGSRDLPRDIYKTHPPLDTRKLTHHRDAIYAQRGFV